MQAEKEETRQSFKHRLALRSSLARESVSEFLGTFVMIVLGCGCVAQAVLSRGSSGGIITINVGFGMAVAMAIYVTGGVSGALCGGNRCFILQRKLGPREIPEIVGSPAGDKETEKI